MNHTDATPLPEPAPETIPEIVLLPKQDSAAILASGGVPPKKEHQGVGQALQSSALQTTPVAGDLPPRRFLSLTGAAAAILAFAFLVVVVYAFTRPSPLHQNADCDTDDCMQHAFLLSATLNRSLDPCEDFGAFVCSAWLASLAHSRSLQEDLWYRWTKQTALELEKLRLYPDARPIVKAAGLLQRCLDMDADASHKNTLFLRHFFSQRNLSAVPGEEPNEGVHALDVLLDLAINWRMPLWFSVAVLKAGGNGSLGVLLDYGRYDAYWVNREPIQVDDNSEDATMDNFILKTLRDLSDIRLQFKPKAIQIMNITRLTPSWSSDLWLKFLNKHLAPAFTVVMQDHILLTDSNLLEIIGGISVQYDNAAVLQHIARVLNKIFSNLVSNSTPHFHDPDEAYPTLPESSTLVCHLQVEDLFKPVLAVNYVVAKKLVVHRATVDAILQNVIQTAIDMLTETKWIGEENKKRMLQQMKALTINVLPDQQFMIDKTLSDLYRNFPGSRGIYARDMIESLTVIRRHLGTDLYTDLTSTPHGGRDPYLLYNVFNNSFTVAVGALSAPLFYPEGTTAMNYGGLGAAFASVLLRAIDGGHAVVGPNGWTLNKAESMYVTAPCVDMSFEGFYPSLPSLEVTHRSYLDALKKTGRSADEKLASLGEFTAEQVFFLTFCHRTCRQFDGVKTSSECNVAVRNFAPFLKAFSCRRGSNMNPNAKCAFFT
ncbi:neprilysin-like isoform X1 [Dermacentor albipictus]|uniref:neprilysin-like isoform X1 n=1 Tax=Dermacentor albipictus TaxID=60249 RepID=UPI0038FD1255